jgi:5-methylcytosine-specific restriction enzyme A
MIKDCFYLESKKQIVSLYQCKACSQLYQSITNHFCRNCHKGHSENPEWGELENFHNICSTNCKEEKHLERDFKIVKRKTKTYLCADCKYLWVAEIESNKKDVEGINYLCCPNCGSIIKKFKLKKIKRKAFTKSIRHEVFKRDNYKCKECGVPNKKAILHIDHIIPLAKGGTDELDNLQTLCEACNISKGINLFKKVVE